MTTTIIINQQNEIKYIYETFNKHSRASEAAIIVEEIYGGTLSAPQYRPRLVPKCAPGYQF